ncbi:MAG: hypothetical protein M3Q33_08210 [Acidobacteriota bacterium]|nr:hypothetical protein [Acidobacteriota bacterium]
MSDTTNGKIQNLLAQASRQSDSAKLENSSVAKATRVFPTDEEAKKAFSRLHAKLFSIERWESESVITSFELFDENGIPQPKKNARGGDFIKSVLPGSGKDDWVKIIEIYETTDEIVLTVQPSYNPTAKTEKSTTSHFFTADATNNFCLQRDGAKVNFYVIGLHERSNVEDTGGVLETVRNVATANIGRFFGIQKIQWQTFCENFIEIEE